MATHVHVYVCVRGSVAVLLFLDALLGHCLHIYLCTRVNVYVCETRVQPCPAP